MTFPSQFTKSVSSNVFLRKSITFVSLINSLTKLSASSIVYSQGGRFGRFPVNFLPDTSRMTSVPSGISTPMQSSSSSELLSFSSESLDSSSRLQFLTFCFRTNPGASSESMRFIVGSI